MRRALSASILVPLVACDAALGYDDVAPKERDPSTISTTVGGGGSVATNGGAGGTAGAGASAGGEGGLGGGGGQIGTRHLPDYWPLAVGASWTYQVAAVGGGGICTAGTFVVDVESQSMLDGRDAFYVTPWCSGATGTTPYAWDEDGNLLLYFNSTWELALSNELTDGATFQSMGLTYRWHSEGSVTVSGTVYDDCWSARQVGANYFSTYCYAVGPVQHYNADMDSNGWDAQLTDTN